MRAPVQSSCDVHDQVVRSESLRTLFSLAEKVATHPAAVLIVGETGTGKEMLARSIHKHSLRCNQPWVDVNCAAMPEHLVESELFGYEKGAFSGADSQKPGLFEMADGGTLFLDEVGDLDPKVQVKLLRVLDGVPYFRLGGSKKVSVDVRIVAATNQNLEELVKKGRFRSDLYHRLAQFKLEVPALRDRPEDLIGIAEHLLHQHWPESHFSGEAIAAMLAHEWPGNIRELRNCIFRAVMVGKNPAVQITAADLKLPTAVSIAHTESNLVDERDEFERQKVYDALELCGGNQGRAAEFLGISRRTLLRKLKSYREARVDDALGTLCIEQQRYYRVKLKAPAVVDCQKDTLHGTLINLSVGGAAVSLGTALKFGSAVNMKFQMPGNEEWWETNGRVAWSNSEGDHGIQFSDLKPQVRSTLQRWLHERMKKEGWHPDCPD